MILGAKDCLSHVLNGWYWLQCFGIDYLKYLMNKYFGVIGWLQMVEILPNFCPIRKSLAHLFNLGYALETLWDWNALFYQSPTGNAWELWSFPGQIDDLEPTEPSVSKKLFFTCRCKQGILPSLSILPTKNWLLFNPHLVATLCSPFKIVGKMAIHCSWMLITISTAQ